MVRAFACPLLALALLSATASASQAQAPTTEKPLRWLAGCWAAESSATVIEEHWLAPRGGAMLGIGRMSRRDSLVAFEYMRIRTWGDSLALVAAPSGQTETEFRGRVNGGEFTVENPAHDFPQRLVYRAVGGDSLVVRIEGDTGGSTRAVTFPFARVACPGG